jgi:hypothetical protein
MPADGALDVQGLGRAVLGLGDLSLDVPGASAAIAALLDLLLQVAAQNEADEARYRRGRAATRIRPARAAVCTEVPGGRARAWGHI